MCGRIKGTALVSTESTSEDDFYLQVHVSFHLQLTNVGVPLVDECWCNTTGYWISYRSTVINFVRRVWHALHLEKAHNWFRPVSVTVTIQGDPANIKREYQFPVSATHRNLRLDFTSFWRAATFRPGVRLYCIECRQRGSLSHICQNFPFFHAFWYSLFNPLKPSGHYMYRQFNIQQFYVLPTHCIYVFCVDLRTNSDYFPIQH